MIELTLNELFASLLLTGFMGLIVGLLLALLETKQK